VSILPLNKSPNHKFICYIYILPSDFGRASFFSCCLWPNKSLKCYCSSTFYRLYYYSLAKLFMKADEDLCLCPLCLHSRAAHDLESFGLGVAIVHEMKRGNCQDIINYLCTKRGGERSQETKIEYMIEELHDWYDKNKVSQGPRLYF